MAATKLIVEPTDSIAAREPAPTHAEIEMRAYQIWETRLRHGAEGDAELDWAQAEQELTGSKPHSLEKEGPEV